MNDIALWHLVLSTDHHILFPTAEERSDQIDKTHDEKCDKVHDNIHHNCKTHKHESSYCCIFPPFHCIGLAHQPIELLFRKKNSLRMSRQLATVCT